MSRSAGRRAITSADAPPAIGGYAQAVETIGPGRLLHISGQIPVDREGGVPDGFEAQCRLVWKNLFAQLAAAGMGPSNLVKVTTYLAHRRFGDENGRIRREILGAHAPALTVVIAGIFDEQWLLEIEAVAAD